MSLRPPDPRLLEFLSAYDRSIVDLALALRAMVLEAAPEAVEAIYDAYSAVAIGFSFTGKPLKDGFCHIVTYADHVNLGFNRGAQLPDPRKLLKGSGKQIRHLSLNKPADLDAPHLRKFLRAAIDQVSE